MYILSLISWNFKSYLRLLFKSGLYSRADYDNTSTWNLCVFTQSIELSVWYYLLVSLSLNKLGNNFNKYQGCVHGEIFGATSATMVGKIWNRVKLSKKFAATAAIPVAPEDTFLNISNKNYPSESISTRYAQSRRLFFTNTRLPNASQYRIVNFHNIKWP